MMTEIKDWGKFSFGIWAGRLAAAAVIIGLGWFFLFSPWGSCGRQDIPVVEFAKRDSAIQLTINSYQLQVDSLKLSIDSLEKCITELEQSRHEILVNAKNESKIVENKSVTFELYPQMRMWLTGRPPLPIPSPIRTTGAQERGDLKVYSFDSLDVLSMAKKKIEHDYLITDNKLLGDEIINYKSQIANYKWQVSDLTKINQFKDEQIVKLEALPRVTVNKRKWYTDVLIVTGSVAVGFTAGIIYQNNRK